MGWGWLHEQPGTIQNRQQQLQMTTCSQLEQHCGRGRAFSKRGLKSTLSQLEQQLRFSHSGRGRKGARQLVAAKGSRGVDSCNSSPQCFSLARPGNELSMQPQKGTTYLGSFICWWLWLLWQLCSLSLETFGVPMQPAGAAFKPHSGGQLQQLRQGRLEPVPTLRL